MAYSDADLQVKTGSAAFAQCQANFIALTAEALTIAAVKTFSSSPIVPTPTTDMQASTKKYVDDTAVALTGNQTVAGVKTFSTPIAVGSGGTGASAAANAASGVVVLNASSQLPAVSGALLTNLPTTKAILGIDSGYKATNGAVSFNFTFASAPNVVVTPNSVGSDYGRFSVSDITTTGFTIISYSATSFQWIAIGTKA